MTIKEFARQSGIKYMDLVNMILISKIHKRGKNVDYPFENLRSAVVEQLMIKQEKAEQKLAGIKLDLKRAYAVESDE